ncbi:O-antigen ligase family protein [Pollutimonas bauzanensis]|uniref:O-antigen ligase n=1 Tax=Pollutimonas bauzanensis TaxID=658167 RepID=A0A1M6BLU9_9BURK|nr:O-antigen ligase family protein [Pollutimonas bauzanensis]SHI49528.1 O-antigen ligase [Pollutimonas bauzanensis]
MIEAPYQNNKILGLVVSLSVFLFFAPMLSVPAGYTTGAVLLLLASFCSLAKRPCQQLTREDKTLISLLVAIFAVSLFSFLYHGNAIRSMDLPSRYLLAVPILLLMLKVPPRLSWWWAGMVVGCVSGAGVAFWQIELLQANRAVGYTGVIQFGNLGMMMGVFCAAGLFWAKAQGRYARYWQLALLVGLLAGAYVSIASGSRGGWLALPFVAPVFCAAFLSRRNLKQAFAVLAVLCVGLTVVATTVPSIETRYDEAVSEIQKYQTQRVSNTSLGLRLEMWHALTLMIPQKPLLGWSESNYKAEMQRLVAEDKVKADVLTMANTHNNYLEFLAFQGVAGLLPVLALLLTALWYFCKRLRSINITVRVLAVCGASLLVAYSLFGMSQVMLGRNNTLLFFVIALTVTWGAMRREEIRLAAM